MSGEVSPISVGVSVEGSSFFSRLTSIPSALVSKVSSAASSALSAMNRAAGGAIAALKKAGQYPSTFYTNNPKITKVALATLVGAGAAYAGAFYGVHTKASQMSVTLFKR